MQFLRNKLVALVLVISACPAHAHGIAGNRYFDGTLGFDDPAVADEAILPYYANSVFPAQGSNSTENRINWAFARLLTPTLAFTADGGWLLATTSISPDFRRPCLGHRPLGSGRGGR